MPKDLETRNIIYREKERPLVEEFVSLIINRKIKRREVAVLPPIMLRKALWSDQILK